MKLFPKKYNHKNIKNKTTIKSSKNKVYSKYLPIDQNIHPGILFSIFFQNYYSQIQTRFGKDIYPTLGFSLSSIYYSNINKKNTNLKKLYLEAKKQFKKNIKFLDKIGIFHSQHNNQIGSIDFYIFVRDYFCQLYKAQQILFQKEILFRNKEKQTNISYNSIQTKQEKSKCFTIKYFIEAKGISLSVETDSIETIFADVAVAVSPKDKRYKKFVGQNVIIPIINKNIPIIQDESVDPFTGSGVVRITPGHDQYGLEIAQKHNLTTTFLAIDIYGNFTEHAGEFSGKPVKDFYDNIIKYIDDIGNLDNQTNIIKDYFYDHNSGDSLYKITLNQWNIKHSYTIDYLIEQINTNHIKTQSEDIKNNLLSHLETLSHTPISAKSSNGILIPIIYSTTGQTYIIDENILLEQYKQSKSKKDFTISVITLNLILNNQLKSQFAIEKLIDVLFDINYSHGQTLLSSYLELYNTYSNSIFRNGIKSLKKLLNRINDDIEKIKTLEEILENSFAFTKSGDYYQLDFSIIFNTNQKLRLQYEDSFNKNILDILLFIFNNKLNDQKESSFLNTTCSGDIFLGLLEEHEFILNLLIISLEYTKYLPISNLFFYPTLVLEEGKPVNHHNTKFMIKEFSHITNLYGPDTLRLALLLAEQDKNEVLFDMFNINQFQNNLNKIWNAYRYIYHNFFTQNFNFTSVPNDITEYDSWILHGFKSLLEEIKYQIQENNYIIVGNKILNFLTDTLCNKYLESLKFFVKTDTNKIASFIFVNSLHLLKSLVPHFTQELLATFKLEHLKEFDIINISNITLNEKNYKINILMEIVDNINNIKTQLGLSKHDIVDVFVQSNPDFLNFLGHNIAIFKKLTNTQELLLIQYHEEIPNEYKTNTIININIGAKISSQVSESNKNSIPILLDELEHKKEHLHYVKSLMASVSSSLSSELLSKKKDEIKSLQNEIDALKLIISKLKLKNT